MFVMKYWEKFEPIDQIWHVLIAYLYTFIAFFSFIANIMVIYYLTRVKKKGRQDGSYFIINLAIVDILKSSSGLPLVVASSFNGRWIFGQIGCSFYGFTGGVFGLTSLATLSIMSIERFVIVSNPLRIFDNKFKIICIMATWIYGLIWSVLQFGSQHGYVLEGFLTSCSFDYLSRDLYTRVFMSSMIIGGFFVPLIVLIIFLWLTKRALETKLNEFGENQVYVFNSKSRTKEYSRAVTTLSRTDSLLDRSYSLTRSRFGGDVSIDDNRKFSFKKRQFRVIKTILLNIIFFCVSWTPYCILVIIAQYGSNIEEYVNPYTTSIPALVAKLSSIYNPILYTLNNQECRSYFKKVFFH